MKTKKTIETKLEVELTAQDVLQYVVDKKLVPSDWKFYSVEVTGNGISQGANLVIKHTDSNAA